MTPPRLPYVNSYRDRHGRVRHYFRRGRMKRVPLAGHPGSAEFEAAWRDAMRAFEAGELSASTAAQRTIPGSMDDLIARYLAGRAFRELAPTTRAVYRRVIGHIRADHGNRAVAAVTPQALNQIIRAKENASGPEAAKTLLKILSVLFALAVDEGMLRSNPAKEVRRPRSTSSGYHSWTDAEVHQFQQHWPRESRERLALDLMLYTGCRRGDAVKLGPQHVKAGRVQYRQNKTQRDVDIPLHPSLAETILAHPPSNLAFLTTAYGKPFSVAGFGNFFRDACRAAGLTECSSHGLRKAMARRLAESGCTPHHIMAVTGHRSLSEVERYCREAGQVGLADEAYSRLQAREALTNPPGKLVNFADKSLKQEG